MFLFDGSSRLPAGDEADIYDELIKGKFANGTKIVFTMNYHAKTDCPFHEAVKRLDAPGLWDRLQSSYQGVAFCWRSYR